MNPIQMIAICTGVGGLAFLALDLSFFSLSPIASGATFGFGFSVAGVFIGWLENGRQF